MRDNFTSKIPKDLIPYSLPSNWTWFFWADIIKSYQQGMIRSNRELGEGNVYYLKMGDLDDKGIVNLTNLAKTNASEKEINEFQLHEGDFLINVRNSRELVGKTCVIREIDNVILYNHMLVRIDNGNSKMNYFINAFLNIPSSKKLLDRIKQGTTTVIALYYRELSQLPISLPDSLTFNTIVSFYKSIDSKIELNNKINRELEAMAKMLYDYWFVQFDFPNEQGKPYKSSGGKMVYNPELKREIPDGWEVKTLLDIATYTNGLACQNYRPINTEFLPVIKIREMREGYTENTEKVKADIPKKLIVNNGDVLFSWSASLEVMIWYGGKGGLNQHIFKVTSKKYPRSFYYFQLIWYLKHFKMIAELRKTTMGHITQDHLKQSRIVIPPVDIVKQLDKLLFPIQEKQILLCRQNQQLSELRDWLLPMLMNGQVTVKEAEVSLSMAVEPSVEYSAYSSRRI